MIKVDYFLLAEDVQVDDASRTSIINIVERLNVPEVPIGLENIKITARLHPEDQPVVNETLKLNVAFVLKGETVQTIDIEQPVTMELGTGWAPTLDVNDLVFPEFGEYAVVLSVNGQEMARTNLSVRNIAEFSEP